MHNVKRTQDCLFFFVLFFFKFDISGLTNSTENLIM